MHVRKQRAPKGALRPQQAAVHIAHRRCQKAPSAKRRIKTVVCAGLPGVLEGGQKVPSAKRRTKTW